MFIRCILCKKPGDDGKNLVTYNKLVKTYDVSTCCGLPICEACRTQPIHRLVCKACGKLQVIDPASARIVSSTKPKFDANNGAAEVWQRTWGRFDGLWKIAHKFPFLLAFMRHDRIGWEKFSDPLNIDPTLMKRYYSFFQRTIIEMRVHLFLQALRGSDLLREWKPKHPPLKFLDAFENPSKKGVFALVGGFISKIFARLSVEPLIKLEDGKKVISYHQNRKFFEILLRKFLSS